MVYSLQMFAIEKAKVQKMCRNIRSTCQKKGACFLLSGGGFMEFKFDFCKKIAKMIDKLRKKDKKWKIFLYLDGQLVSKIYVGEEFKPMENLYITKIKHAKHLIGTNRKTTVILQYYKYKLTDNSKREVHIETLIYRGSDLVQ